MVEWLNYQKVIIVAAARFSSCFNMKLLKVLRSSIDSSFFLFVWNKFSEKLNPIYTSNFSVWGCSIVAIQKATWWVCLMQQHWLNYESRRCSCNCWQSNTEERFNFVWRICVEFTQKHTRPSSIRHKANSEMRLRPTITFAHLKSFQIGNFMFKAKCPWGESCTKKRVDSEKLLSRGSEMKVGTLFTRAGHSG